MNEDLNSMEQRLYDLRKENFKLRYRIATLETKMKGMRQTIANQNKKEAKRFNNLRPWLEKKGIK